MNAPNLMGNGEGHTLLILTDAESREFKADLEKAVGLVSPRVMAIFHAGVLRGTERLAAEFAAGQKAKKEKAAK